MAPSPLDPRRLRNSCDVCTVSKLKCSREKPVCQRCVDRGCQQDCNYSLARRPGRRRRTSLVSDDSGSYHPDTVVNGMRIGQGKEMVPLTPASTFADPLLSIGKRHNSIQDAVQQRNIRVGDDEHTTMMSPGMTWMESLLSIPMETTHSNGSRDAESIDFEAIDNLSLWDWNWSGVNIGTLNSHKSASMVQMSDIQPGQAMPSGTEVGVNYSLGEPRQERSSSPSYSLGTAASNLVSDLSKDVNCKCSSQIGQLMYLITLRRAAPTLVDVVFAVDQQLNQTKDTIHSCANHCLDSPYMSMMFCTLMSWVIEHIGTYVRDVAIADVHNGQIPFLTIGGLALSKEMSRACFEALVKLRLRRIFQTARSFTSSNIDANSTLWDGVRSTAGEIGATAQQMFGMLELRGSS